MKKKAVLITGVAGFIGFHLAKRLLAEGENVVGFDNLNDYYDPALKVARLHQLGLIESDFVERELVATPNGKLHFFKGNLEDDTSWNLLQSNFTITSIIHLAAQAGVRYSLEQPRKYISANVLGFLNVLEFCREIGLKKLIYASSSSVYGMESKQPFSEDEVCDKPVSLYAASKRSNELMAYTYWHLNGIESLGLRFFTVYGPWGRPDMAPFLFTKAAFDGQVIKVFNYGNQSRDFTFIDDIVQGIYAVFSSQKKIIGAQVCNIGKGSPISLSDFIKAIERTSGKVLKKDFVDAQLGDVAHTYADTSTLTSLFQYEPKTSLEEGVSQFIQWFKEFYRIS